MNAKITFGLIFWGILFVLALVLWVLPHREVAYEVPKPIIDLFSIEPSHRDGDMLVHQSDSKIVIRTTNAVSREILYQGQEADADTIFRDNAETFENTFVLGDRRLEGEVWARAYNEKGDFVESPRVRITYEQPEIIIEYPEPEALISAPVTVRGRVRGFWFFEASMPVSILDADKQVLAKVPVQAIGEWMTEDFVSFEGTIPFVSPTSSTGFVLFENDNPSGLAEHAKFFLVPVRFQ